MQLFKDRTEFIGVLICLASAIIFGLYPAAARAVYQDGGNIVLVILVTTFTRLFGLFALAKYKKLRLFPKLKEYKNSLYAGFFQAFSIIGILGGSFFMPGAVVIIIMFTYSLMLLFFSAWRGDMKLNAANIISTLIALFGLALVLKVGTEQGLSYPLIGITLAIMAAFCTFIRSYIFGHESKSRHPIVTGTEVFFVAFIILLGLLLWENPIFPETITGLIMLAAAAISLTIGSYGMFYGIAYLGPYRFSMIMKLEPVFTTIFGIFLVNDTLILSQYLGITLVLTSLISLQLFDKQK